MDNIIIPKKMSVRVRRSLGNSIYDFIRECADSGYDLEFEIRESENGKRRWLEISGHNGDVMLTIEGDEPDA